MYLICLNVVQNNTKLNEYKGNLCIMEIGKFVKRMIVIYFSVLQRECAEQIVGIKRI